MTRARRFIPSPAVDMAKTIEHIEIGRVALRAALLAGDPTAAIRRDLAEHEARLADMRAELEAASADEAGRREADVAARAEGLTADAHAQIVAMLADLQPPPAPATTKDFA